jgi:hypothetical protein
VRSELRSAASRLRYDERWPSNNASCLRGVVRQYGRCPPATHESTDEVPQRPEAFAALGDATACWFARGGATTLWFNIIGTALDGIHLAGITHMPLSASALREWRFRDDPSYRQRAGRNLAVRIPEAAAAALNCRLERFL